MAIRLNAAVVALLFSATAISALGSILTIPLDKQYVPVLRNQRTAMYKTTYFGTIVLGAPQPQLFTVVFDTGSGHLIVPWNQCKSRSCLQRRHLYDREASASAVDVDYAGNAVVPGAELDEVAISYGTGQVEGPFVREQVCLGAISGSSAATSSPGVCTTLRVILAAEMSDEPFQSFQFDGVLGLGLDHLSLEPEFSFFGQMTKQHPEMEARFGVFLARDDGLPSEISFGGYDARRMSGDLKWTPVVHPELGYWVVKVHGVRVGDSDVDFCEQGDCLAILDTGTSLLGVPKPLSSHLNMLLARKVDDAPDEMDCTQHPGPAMIINLGQGTEITLDPEDYSRPAGLRIMNNKTNKSQFVCRAQLLPVEEMPSLGSKVWILGEPVLRKYYSVYDWAAKQVGFANAAQPSLDPAARQQHLVLGRPPAELPYPTVVHV